MQIEQSAFGPIRSFLGDYVVAAWREAQGGDPILFGGRRAGHDVSYEDLLGDAKVSGSCGRCLADVYRAVGCSAPVDRRVGGAGLKL
jgi:hypothetical protein